MLKAGIMSMQRILNYGSFLQAYGLKKILEELGCKVEFVDYHKGDCLVKSADNGVIRDLGKVAEVFGCHATIKDKLRFIKYKKNYAKNYYPVLDINQNMNFTPELDLLLIGSDEVFNCTQSNTNVGYSPELFGANNRAKRLISYGASFGNTTLVKLNSYGIKNEISAWLNEFDALSVRDVNSGKVVRDLIGIEPEYHLDPVLIYDFLRKEKIPDTVDEKGYIVLYGYTGRFSVDECRAIQKYAKKNGLKILCIGGIQHCCDRFVDCSPFEVISYFKNAWAIITDTFHGTIISVITHQRFITIARRNDNMEKLIDLMHRLNLKGQLLINWDELDNKICNSIDYSKIDLLIKRERQRSYDYLEREIKLCI